MASAMIGNLAVSLTMQTAAFQRGATLAEKRVQTMRGKFAAATASVTGFGKALGAGIAADVLYRITASAFEMASSLAEAAEQVGVTVEGLQELRFAAEQTGVGADKIEAAMKRLNRSLGDLQLGKAAAVKVFAEIGLSADELRGKRPDEALRLIADALNKLPDASSRVAVGQQLMGRSFSDLLPLINGGSEALDRYAQASRANGQVSTEDAARLDDLADSWEGLKNRVLVNTAKIISAAVQMGGALVSAFEGIGLKVNLFDLTIVGMVTNALEAVNRLATGVGQWIRGVLGNIWDNAIAKIKAVEATFSWLWDRVVGHSHIPDMVDGIAAEMARLDAVMVRPVTAATSKVEQAFRDSAREVRGILDRLFPDSAADLEFRANQEALGGIADPGARAEAMAALLAERDVELKRRANGGIIKRGADDVAKPLTALDEAFNNVLAGLDQMADRSEATTVRVAKSFKDMADDTLSALGRLSSAIKGGGFLGILEAVIGLGLQLGSVGAFGGKIAGRINGTAGAGSFVSPSRGNTGRATNVVEIVDTTGLFVTRVNGQIMQQAPGIVQAGAKGGVALMNQQQSRRWR